MPNKIGRFFFSKLVEFSKYNYEPTTNFLTDQDKSYLFISFFSLLPEISDGLKKNHDNTKYLYE